MLLVGISTLILLVSVTKPLFIIFNPIALNLTHPFSAAQRNQVHTSQVFEHSLLSQLNSEAVRGRQSLIQFTQMLTSLEDNWIILLFTVMNAFAFEINTKLKGSPPNKNMLPTLTLLLIPYLIGSCIKKKKKLKRVHPALLLRRHC